MGKFVEKNLIKDEVIVKKAEINKLCLIGKILNLIIWISIFFYAQFYINENSFPEIMNTIVLVFFGLAIFFKIIGLIMALIRIYCMDLVITNKRLFGKIGMQDTTSCDVRLEKVDSSSVDQTFFGKIFNYSDLSIKTGTATFVIPCIKDAEKFKGMITEAMETAKEEAQKKAAEEQAKALAQAIAAANAQVAAAAASVVPPVSAENTTAQE